MKKCPYPVCEQENEDLATHCWKCGTPFDRKAVEVSQQLEKIDEKIFSPDTWVQKKEKGILKAAWDTIYTSIFLPKNLLLKESNEHGVKFFYSAFSLCCLIPVVLINILVANINLMAPDVFEFYDAGPSSMIGAFLLQLLILPVALWLAGVCFYEGFKNAEAASAKDRGLIRSLVWHVGTALFCMLFWFIGLGTILSSIKILNEIKGLIDPLFAILFLGGVIIGIRALILSFKANLNLESSKAVLGLVLGGIFYVLASIPLAFILSLIIR